MMQVLRGLWVMKNGHETISFSNMTPGLKKKCKNF